MSKVSFDLQGSGHLTLADVLALRLSRVSRRKKDDFAWSGNCKVSLTIVQENKGVIDQAVSIEVSKISDAEAEMRYVR